MERNRILTRLHRLIFAGTAHSNFVKQIGPIRNSLDHIFLPEIALDENGTNQLSTRSSFLLIITVNARSNFLEQVGPTRNSLDRAFFSGNRTQ